MDSMAADDAVAAESIAPGLGGSIYTDVPLGAAMRPTPPQTAVADEPRYIYLRGIRIHAMTEAQSVRYVLDSLSAGRGGWVVTPNLDHLRRLSGDRALRALYSHATLVVPDGMPL